MQYTPRQLENGIIRDIIADIRFCGRLVSAGQNVDENSKYAERCRAELSQLLAERKRAGKIALDRNGWPIVLHK